jgi:glycerol-3-phosphate O-acyltransferase
LQSDELWQEEQRTVHEVWQKCQKRVEEPCNELKIPKRFQPAIAEPVWRQSLVLNIQDLRAAVRAEAYKQIAAMVKYRLEEIEREKREPLASLPESVVWRGGTRKQTSKVFRERIWTQKLSAHRRLLVHDFLFRYPLRPNNFPFVSPFDSFFTM